MSESVYRYEATVPFPLPDVWAAMGRTADLDVAGGQAVTERISDSEWTTELDGKATTHCTATCDEAAHRVEVVLDSTAKRDNDTTAIWAEAADGGTRVTVEQTVRGGHVVMGMLKLVGGGALDKVAATVVANIAAICEGRDPRAMSAEEREAYAQQRIAEWAQEHRRG